MELTLEHLEAIFENANETIILLKEDYTVIGFNKVAKARLLLNTQKEIIKGADFRNFLYPGREILFETLFANALNGNIQESEVHAQSKDGSDIWFRSKLFPVYNKTGSLLGIALFALDISRRKIAEIALMESEEKFRKIMESAPTPILALDNNLKIVFANKETERAFDFKYEELLGSHINLILPSHNDLLLKCLSIDAPDYLPAKFDKQHDIVGICKNGTRMNLELNVNSFMVKNQKFLILIIVDVTDKLKAEQKILEQYHSLQQIAQEQSHEVRRPVANILGIVNIFKTIDNLTEKEKGLYLEALFTATSQLDNIIRRIVLQASDPVNDESL